MWTIDQIVNWGGGALQGTPAAPAISGFSIDTRTLRPGEIFIALKGTRSDGHDFIEAALKKGAAGAMVSRGWFQSCRSGLFPGPVGFFIVVDDPLAGLQSLAKWHRQQFRGPLVGITGSNGKTSTKEMLAKILSRRGPVLKNEGNLNNHIGLPLSLLHLTNNDPVAVLEMGISQRGDMKQLCDIARPSVGIITNIGPAHLEFLETLEGVAAEKTVLFEAVESNETGISIINRDDPFLAPWEEKARQKWTYAIEKEAHLTATDIEQTPNGITFTLRLHRNGGGGGNQKIVLSLFGEHQVYNALAASAAALALGYEFDEIREALREIRPVPLRGEVIKIAGATLLLDAYNANLGSMKAALQTLITLGPASRNVAVLGDMLELGKAAEKAHRDLGGLIAQNKLDRLIAVGHYAEAIARGAAEGGMSKKAITLYKSAEEVNLANEIQEGDVVLIKGSRGMKMERLLETLKEGRLV